MIKHGYNKEEMTWMRLKLPKLGLLSDLSNLKPSSCRDVSRRRRDMGYEPRQRRDVRVLMPRRGASDPSNIEMCDLDFTT